MLDKLLRNPQNTGIIYVLREIAISIFIMGSDGSARIY